VCAQTLGERVLHLDTARFHFKAVGYESELLTEAFARCGMAAAPRARHPLRAHACGRLCASALIDALKAWPDVSTPPPGARCGRGCCPVGLTTPASDNPCIACDRLCVSGLMDAFTNLVQCPEHGSVSRGASARCQV